MWFDRHHSNHSQINRWQMEREQLMTDIAELQDDLKTMQGIIRRKQQKLRTLNQKIAGRTRHATQWQVVPACTEQCCTNSACAANTPRQSFLTCLPGGKTD